jgi:hypothetical protein
MENKMLLSKLRNCCEKCGRFLIDENVPIFISNMRDIEIELKNYNASYIFHFCPWCNFKYYDMQKIWEKDLLETHGIRYHEFEDNDEWIEIPAEFETNKWWIERGYLDIINGYGAENYEPITTTIDNCCCDSMFNLLDKNGHDSFRSYINYFPIVRTYVIYNKKELSDFIPMDYCPFCGIKFPKRLDEELTEILKSEYGLNSWKDYKKAPPEFHTDEWWKKRGL